MNKKIKILKNYLSVNKKRILITYIFIFASLIVFLFIDQMTKNLLFNHGSIKTLDQNFEVSYNGQRFPAESILNSYTVSPLLGIRSIWHGGITFAKTRNTTLIQTISIILFIFILTYGLFLDKHNKIRAIFVGIILAGDLGNMLDRFIFSGYVKDIFFIPFLNRDGTFNFADSLIFTGIALLLIGSLIPENKIRDLKRHRDLIIH
ncbi:signal peptidase II [Mycoplasma sp. 6243]|uniref:signal peptidase II n=1 Tax=Mycoplasma sp. 6243 TaxID=3440865 RepID=UPI003EC0CFCF